MQKESVQQKNWKRIPDWLEGLAILGGAACVAAILLSLITCGEYSERLADNKYLMAAALAFALSGGIAYFLLLRREKTSAGLLKHPVLLLFAGYLILYTAQLLWVDRVYFYSGWDVVMMKERVEWILGGGTMQGMSIDYTYSVYPNNLLLFYLFCLIEKAGRFFSMAEPYKLCIYLSCLCVNLSCFLGNLMMRRLTKSGVVRCCYTVISSVFILFSPWIIIPYSDTYGMLLAMLGMWGLVCVDRKYLKWAVTAFAAVIGYYIKPTCIFPLFAAYIVYGIRYLFSLRGQWRQLCALIVSTAVFWCGGLLVPLWIQHTYSFRLMPERRVTIPHYLMMGLNEETNGAYSSAYFEYSNQFPNVEAREQANRAEIARRWGELTAGHKLGEFIRVKSLINFNDGTFAWAGEGAFFFERVEHDNILWDWFLDTMVPPGTWENEGKYYCLYRTVMQAVWLLVLTGMVFVGFGRKKKRMQKACMAVVLCGLMAFVMIFEARARYLFLYSPAFVVLSLCGYEGLWRRGAAWYLQLRRRASVRLGTSLRRK